MPPTHPPRFSFEQYQRFRHVAEIGFWVISLSLAAAGNSVTVGMELTRAGIPHHPTEPAIWEWSSNLVILALIPALLGFTRRYPLHLDTGRRYFAIYLLASAVFSLAHVLGMVAAREVVYALAGGNYNFGDWPRQLAYEYIKDIRTFFGTVLTIEAYRFLLRRWQGEASLLGSPDDDTPPAEPVERPERFLVRKLGREFLIAASDIECLSAAGNYVNLHVRGRDYPLRSTIAAIGERLDPQRFLRVHRSHIVNLDQIAMIEPLDSGDARLHLKNGNQLPCSRRYRDSLRDWAA